MMTEFKVNYFLSNCDDRFLSEMRAVEDLLRLLGFANNHGGSHGIAQFTLTTHYELTEVLSALATLSLSGELIVAGQPVKRKQQGGYNDLVAAE